MSKPVVAIVGRPNVGKSSLFNTLYGERISIVHDTPGVTRDRLYAEANWRGRDFIMIDTGGIEPETDDVITRNMRLQAEIAIETSDVIIFMCDIQAGLTAADEEIAVMLRKSGRPVVCAVNKVDKIGDPPAEFYEFYNLGLDDCISLSASHRLGIGELLDAVFVEPVRAVDYHFVGLVASEVLETHFLVARFKTHIDLVESALFHTSYGVFGEDIEAYVAGAGKSDFGFVEVDELVEPVGEHIEYRIAEVDDLDLRMTRKQRL